MPVTVVAVDLDDRGFDDDEEATAARATVTRAATALLDAAGVPLDAPFHAVSASFSRPADGLAFALALRRELQTAHPPSSLRVALHTGENDARPLNATPAATAFRILSLAQAGQILVSRATADFLRDYASDGIHLHDLGSCRPRDLGRALHVLEVRDNEQTEFSGHLRSLDDVPNNLPVQLTSFVGRGAEMADAARLLASSRILTLSGPGGCGKTRLALQLSADVVEQHPDGVWIADLAPIADPGFVATAAADAVGIGAVPGKTTEQALVDHLQPLSALLILDNCEHLVEVSSSLAENLVRGCPRLVVLATSREPLGCDGEVTWRVPSLSLPGSDSDVAAAESVQLFVDRASAVRPSFRVDEANAAAVAEICGRLDGIPLAIELAAARARALTPAEIAHQLADRFALLSGGRHATLPRHRTLEASVDWSYALLEPDQRTLLCRLGVFAGGLDLRAAEEVCSGMGVEAWAILDALTGLVDRSLVQLDDDTGRGRYRLLETIRQYALGKLVDAGEVGALRDRHLQYFLTVATDAATGLEGPDMLRILAALDLEIDNMRAAFDWAMQSGRMADAWGLAGSLWLFWQRHRADEGALRLSAALETPGGEPLARAQALIALADLSFYVGDLAGMPQMAQEVITLGTEAGDQRMMGRGTNVLGVSGLFLGDPEAVNLIIKALELSRASGDDYFVVDSLLGLALAGWFAGDAGLVRSSARESLAVCEGNANPQLRFRALSQTSFAAWMEGGLDEMSETLDEVIPLAAALSDEVTGPVSSALQAWVWAARGRYDEARELVARVIARTSAVNSVLGLAVGLWAKAVIEDDLGLDLAVTSLEQAQAMAVGCGLLHLGAECSARLAARAAAEGDHARAGIHVANISELAVNPHGGACRPWEQLATAHVARVSKETERAGSAIHDALAIWTGVGNRLGTVTALEFLACLDAESGRQVEAARLLGATSAERARLRWTVPPATRPGLATAEEALELAMGADNLAAGLAEGAAMDLTEAAAYARRGRGSRRRATSGWSSLTATELEVVRLVTEGLKNAEIAARLLVSPVTVKTHVAHAFLKLGVRNRAELAAFAMRHHVANPD